MDTRFKMITVISLVMFIFLQLSGFAQDDKVLFNTDQSASVSMKKKDLAESFFLFQIDKLNDKFFYRLVINLVSVFILIRYIYFPHYKKMEFFFSFFIFNFVIFLITYLLNKVDMGLGAAFGLFAVFSMLRYRTENISTKDMTYLFLTIAIGLLTAISKASALELCILNGLILLVTFGLEGSLFWKTEFSQTVQYENIEMIKPDNHMALIVDLRKRTGLNIHRIVISKVDFLKDTALVELYYYNEKQLPLPVDPIDSISDNINRGTILK